MGKEWFKYHYDQNLESVTNATLENAQKGDVSAARLILREFCGAVNQWGEDKEYLVDYSGELPVRTSITVKIDIRYMRYLRDCFQKCLEGEDPKKALNLSQERGGKKDPFLREKKLYTAMSYVRKMESGMDKDAAIRRIAEEGVKFSPDRSLYRPAYNTIRHIVEDAEFLVWAKAFVEVGVLEYWDPQ